MPENVNNHRTNEMDIKNEVENRNKANNANNAVDTQNQIHRSGENKAENTTTDYKR